MKITLIISNNIFYRNYINHFVIDELKKISDLKIIGSNKVIDKKKKIDFTCNEIKTNKIIHKIIAGIRMFSNTHKSKSFKYRIKRRYMPKKIESFKFRPIAKYLKIWIFFFYLKYLHQINFFFLTESF